MKNGKDRCINKLLISFAVVAFLLSIGFVSLTILSKNYLGYQANFNKCASLNDDMPYGSYVPTVLSNVLSHMSKDDKHYLIETTPGVFSKTYLACDESGSLLYDYNILVHNIVSNWGFFSMYAGFEAGPEWNFKYDKLVESGMPPDSTEIFPYKNAIMNEVLNDVKRKPHLRNLTYMYGCASNGMKHKSLLVRVARHGCLGCVKHLVEKYDVDVNHYDCNGVTAAGAAAMRGHFKVAEYLIPLMDKKYINIQFNHLPHASSLYNYMRFGDYEIGVGSGTEFKAFLIKHGVLGSTELRAQLGCFPRNELYANELRNIFVSDKPFNNVLFGDEKFGSVSNCLFLYKQYVHRCHLYKMDCIKRDLIYQYIEDIGFSMDNWENIRYYIKAYVPNDSNDKGDYEIPNEPGYYWIQAKRAANKPYQKHFTVCNKLFKNCSVEVDKPKDYISLPKWYLDTKPRRLKRAI